MPGDHRATSSRDPRRSRSDERITQATLQLLREKGPEAVTIERVAASSGVAKTTIYRRFQNRREMLMAAMTEIAQAPTPPPEVPTREKIRWALLSARDALESTLGMSSVAALLAEQDAEFTQSVRAVLTPYTDHLVELLESAVAAGNLRADIDLDTVLHVILSASLGERLRLGRVREEWLDDVLDVIWSGIGAKT